VKESIKLSNQRDYYIEKIALDARNRLIEEGIIGEDEKALSEEQLKQIVSFFGGELIVHSEKEKGTFIQKTAADKYVIYYYRQYNYIQVIHELGHAFLNFDEMEIGRSYSFDGLGKEDSEASLFARAFIMPRIKFEQVVIDYIIDGKFSVLDIAKEYRIDYLEVLARGEELNIGN